MEIVKRSKDQMTPLERKKAIEAGREFDRFPSIPFMGEFKCQLTGISFREFWYEPDKMAETELTAFYRYGYDRIVIGPNTRGITEALGGRFVYPKTGLPYADRPFVQDYSQLDRMEPVRAQANARIQIFAETAKRLEQVREIVPLEMSIGGPFTIAANLRGVELLLRDTRKSPEEVMRLLRIVTDSQKSCIDMAAEYGFGIAMADPVANPALIGPKMYERFVFPFTKELTDYALERTGEKVSLHMCGTTYSIWKYLRQYELNELSLDNIVDLERAVNELGDAVPIAGNVDPVEIVMNGTKEEIYEGVKACIAVGKSAKKGYHLATGCDIPETTLPQKIDWFMEAAREYGK